MDNFSDVVEGAILTVFVVVQSFLLDNLPNIYNITIRASGCLIAILRPASPPPSAPVLADPAHAPPVDTVSAPPQTSGQVYIFGGLCQG